MAFSNGEDTYKHKYEAVKLLNYDVTRVPGSNETYCFRGTGTADGTTATLLHKFMQCYIAVHAGRSNTLNALLLMNLDVSIRL